MERSRIKANGDSEMALLTKDQFERSWGREDSMIG
jgi:hypothetical protein